MNGYKVFDENLQCRGFQYEIGETYTHVGQIELCQTGFHFHTEPSNLFNYKDFSDDNRVCKVEAVGEVESGDDKHVTDNLKIIRELSWNQVLGLINTGKNNTGRNNSGHSNSGDWNSGDWNSGDWNSGHSNSGDWNSGHSNSGYWNSGDWNSGYWNSGDWNSGDWNSGDWNSGDWNSGDWNSGKRHTGAFNTGEPDYVELFNKPIEYEKYKEIEWPRYFYFRLTEWVDEDKMTDQEKKDHPEFHVRQGYLKEYDYKEAWQKAFEGASEREIEQTRNLPNFDPEIFYEITGIDYFLTEK